MDDSNQDPVYVERVITVDTLSTGESAVAETTDVASPIPVDGQMPKMLTLEALSVEDVCILLNHSHLCAVEAIVRENHFSGTATKFCDHTDFSLTAVSHQVQATSLLLE